MKQVGFKPGVKERRSYEQSGETEEEEMIGEVVGELELVPDEEIEGVDSRDTVKHTERSDV